MLSFDLLFGLGTDFNSVHMSGQIVFSYAQSLYTSGAAILSTSGSEPSYESWNYLRGMSRDLVSQEAPRSLLRVYSVYKNKFKPDYFIVA